MAEAVFPIRFPTDTSGISSGITELERLRQAIQDDQKEIAGLQKAMASLKLDPDVQAFQKMQDELKKLSAAEEGAKKKLGDLQAQRADMVKKGASAEKLAAFDIKGGEAVGKLWTTQQRIQGVRDRLKELDAKPAVKQFKDLQVSLGHTQQSLAGNQSQFLAMGGDMTKIGDKVKSGFDKLAEGADQAGLGLGGLKQKFEALKALGPAGIAAALVVAIVALGVAIAKTTYELGKFALEAADAARSTGLLMEAAAGSQSGGRELDKLSRRLRQDFAGTREEIAGMAIELRRSGLHGIHLERTMRLTGIATKVMGAAASGVLKGLIEKGAMTNRFVLNPFDLRGTGLAYNDVARQLAKMTGRTMATVRAALYNGQVKLSDGIAAMEAAYRIRFGDIAKKQLMSLPEQLSRARENLKDIFAGLNADKVLGGLKSILDLLDESTETGRTLRAIAKTVFQPLLDFVGSGVMPVIRGFLLGVALGFIEISIAALKAYIWFKKSFGDTQLLEGIDAVKIAFYAGGIAIGAFTAILAGMAAFLIGGAVAFLVITAPIIAMGHAIYKVIKAIAALRDALKAKFETPKIAVSGIGESVAKGITDGKPAVNAAMKDLAASGLESFKGELDMHSPSKVLMDTAETGIGGGVVAGVDASRQAVSAAMQRLVSPADAMPAGTSQNGVFGAPPVYVTIDQLIIQGDGRMSTPTKSNLIEELTEVFELAARQGAMVTP